MTARTFFPVKSAPRPSLPELHLVIAALAVSSAIELTILRTFTRTAIHIPAIRELRGPYSVVSFTGEYAYFVTLGLLVPAFIVIGLGLWRSREPGRLVAVYGLGLFAIAFVLAADNPASSLSRGATIAAVVALAGAYAMNRPQRYAMLPVAAFAVAFAAGGAYTLLPALKTHGLPFGQQSWMLDAVEWSGLAFAMTTPLIAGSRMTRGTKWTAAVVFAVVLAAFLGSGSSSRFLLMWNIGLAGSLPAIAYAAAAAALAVAIVALVKNGSWVTGASLALLVTGGIGLHSTYQSALVVAGLAALCYAVPVAGVRTFLARDAVLAEGGETA